MNRIIPMIAPLCLVLLLAASPQPQAASPGAGTGDGELYTMKPLPSAERQRVLLLHSYHEEYIWLQNVDRGIHQALREERYFQGKNIDVQAFYMDTKRKTDAEWKTTVAGQAIDKITTWQPHVVIDPMTMPRLTSLKNWPAHRHPLFFWASTPTPATMAI